MRDAVFGGEEGAVEDFAGIAAAEVAGFGDGMEELECGCTVHGEIVDGFVGDGVVGNERGLGEHGGDGARVGGGEGFSLVMVDVSIGSSLGGRLFWRDGESAGIREL